MKSLKINFLETSGSLHVCNRSALTYTYICICICTYLYIRIYMSICIWVYLYINIYMYITEPLFDRSLKWVVLRIKWQRNDLAIEYLLQIIQGNWDVCECNTGIWDVKLRFIKTISFTSEPVKEINWLILIFGAHFFALKCLCDVWFRVNLLINELSNYFVKYPWQIIHNKKWCFRPIRTILKLVWVHHP